MTTPITDHKNDADGIKTLPTPDEAQATIALKMVPATGDMRIRVDGPTMACVSSDYAYEAVEALGAADACGLPVYAGPTEGTALGNLMVQFIHAGEYASLEEARAAIHKSFEINEYQPR